MVDARERQARRLHRRVDRPRPVRRPELRTCSASCSPRSATGRARASRSTSSRSAARRARSSAASRSTWSAASRTSASGRRSTQLIGVIKVMLDAYSAGRVDRVNLAYNDFVNTMTQKATRPCAAAAAAGRPARERRTTGTTSTNPTPRRVLEHVMTRYVESLVYQAAAGEPRERARRAHGRDEERVATTRPR